jgi:4-hydroxy-4-methyl-2-oxoglutarate aldolase
VSRDLTNIEARLARLDTCAVSDALDRLKLRGVVTGLMPLTVFRKIVGRVITVRLTVSADGLGATTPAVHLGARAIEAAQPGNVIVVEQRTGVVAGSWGGILSIGAKVRGVSGVICDGLVRDVDEARGIEFPIYARGATPLTARGRVVEQETGGPIRIGEETVNSGDYVVADSTGVIFLARERVDVIVNAAEQVAAREFAMAKDLLAGKPITAVMGTNYERMLDT